MTFADAADLLAELAHLSMAASLGWMAYGPMRASRWVPVLVGAAVWAAVDATGRVSIGAATSTHVIDVALVLVSAGFLARSSRSGDRPASRSSCSAEDRRSVPSDENANPDSGERRFAAAVRCAPVAILIVDESGRIAFVNDEAERLFGYSAAEIVGQLVEALIPESLRAVHVDQRAAFSLHPSSRPMAASRDVLGRHRDGRAIDLEIGLSPIETVRGVSVVATVSDVTAHKFAERELQSRTAELLRSNQELEEFAYAASHDLQEPLRTVASYSQLLQHRYAGRLDRNADEFIEFAVDGAVRMQRLVQDLLAYSRVGRGPVEPCATDARRSLDEALRNLDATIRDDDAVVTADPLPVVLADPLQLTQLFQNLIGNALKFHGADRPRVHVDAACFAGAVRFAVRDNGIGIDPKQSARIFQIFQRLHTRQEYEGSGVGLAICKKIVERHGGAIWIDSTVGEGSTFYFTLPAASAGEAPVRLGLERSSEGAPCGEPFR